MPRTKRPIRRQEKVAEKDDAWKKLDKMVDEQKSIMDDRMKIELKNLEISFKVLYGSIRQEDLQKTIGQLKTELHLKEVPTSRITQQSSRAASHDDGYLTENSSHGSGDRIKKKPGIPVSTSRPISCRRSRSADPSLRVPTTSAKQSTVRRRSRSVYRTPAINKMASSSYPAITPKVAPHTPLTVLRQPRQGEMVVSMSGSPVMVPSFNNMQRDEVANCNIMLQDGTMLSLQPKQLRQSQAYIPFSLMDKNMLSQLKTLKDNLDKVVRLGEKAIK